MYELCKWLAAGDCEIFVLAPHHAGTKLRERVQGVNVCRFPYFWPKKLQRLSYGSGILPNLKRNGLLWFQAPLLFLFQLFHAAKIIRNEDIDVIHSHWIIPSGTVGVICRKIFNCPLVVSIHGSDAFHLEEGRLRRLIKWTLMSCDVCTANSSATKSIAHELIGSKNVTVIPMGVDMDAFSPRQNGQRDEGGSEKADAPLILSVGRLISFKGVEYLVRAMPIILERFPQARLLIFGDGTEKASLEELTASLNLDDSVSFAGTIANEQLPSYYRRASVFVLPSIVLDSTGETEALGVVLLEAMASGTPVIGSDVGGISDIIEDNLNGFLVRQKDPQDIAAKIIELLSNEELRHRFSENGLRTVRERFSWNTVAESFGEVYRQLV